MKFFNSQEAWWFYMSTVIIKCKIEKDLELILWDSAYDHFLFQNGIWEQAHILTGPKYAILY